MARSLACAVAVAVAVAYAAGCGGASSTDDAANGIRNGIKAAKPRPVLRTVTQADAESAAKRTVCTALDAYTSDPAQTVADYIQDYANSQRVLQQLNLNEIDPSVADQLAAAAVQIESTQQAAEVANAVGCG